MMMYVYMYILHCTFIMMMYVYMYILHCTYIHYDDVRVHVHTTLYIHYDDVHVHVHMYMFTCLKLPYVPGKFRRVKLSQIPRIRDFHERSFRE